MVPVKEHILFNLSNVVSFVVYETYNEHTIDSLDIQRVYFMLSILVYEYLGIGCTEHRISKLQNSGEYSGL